MPYPENFVVRIIVCVVLMYVVWIGVQFILDVVIFHDPLTLNVVDYVAPLVMGIVEAFVWKPKEKK